MFSRKMIALFVATISVLSLATASSAAQLISIDINASNVKGPTGTLSANSVLMSGNYSYTYAQVGNWNSLNAGPSGSTTSAPISTASLLQSGSAVPTGVVFTIDTNPSGAMFVQDQSITANPDPLRGETITLFPGGASLTWKFTGLTPGQAYDLKFFGGPNGGTTEGGFGQGVQTYSVNNGASPASAAASGVATFIGAIAVLGPSLTGEITGGISADFGNGEWTGLQIQAQEAPPGVPEPSTFVLGALGLAGLGLLAWRRRKGNVECGMWNVECGTKRADSGFHASA